MVATTPTGKEPPTLAAPPADADRMGRGAPAADPAVETTVHDAAAVAPSRRWHARAFAALRSAGTTIGLFLLLFAIMTAIVGGPLASGVPLAVAAVDTEGRPLRTGAGGGRTTVLYVFATWCTACKLTTPTVDDFAARHPEVDVVAIAADDADAVRAALRLQPRRFRVIADDGALARQLGVTALPTTIVLDAAGIVRWNRQGVLLPLELDVRAR